jgi:5-carboxymethyl-2-hydroxymuconate isomerase
MSVPPFNTYLGAEIVRREAGEAQVVLDLGPHHLNRRGVAHGGVIAALLDSALGAAVVSSIPAAWWCATTSLSTQFLDGVGTGRLVAIGRVLRRGARIAFAAGEVRDASGRVIAQAQGTWHLWGRKPIARDVPLRGVAVLAATGERVRVGKVVAVGRNYREHAAEMGVPPSHGPVFFLKPPTAVVTAPTSVRIPTDAGAVHHEVELAALIGAPGRRIPVARALDHVAGFAVALDLTLRDLQTAAKNRGEPWSLAKGFDDAAPLSTVVARDEVGDGSGLAIALDCNDAPRQRGNTSAMARSVAELISHVSRFMTLERGDVLLTGTPAGVGPLVPGDRVEARIERVGGLSLAIEAEE